MADLPLNHSNLRGELNIIISQSNCSVFIFGRGTEADVETVRNLDEMFVDRLKNWVLNLSEITNNLYWKIYLRKFQVACEMDRAYSGKGNCYFRVLKMYNLYSIRITEKKRINSKIHLDIVVIRRLEIRVVGKSRKFPSKLPSTERSWRVFFSELWTFLCSWKVLADLFFRPLLTFPTFQLQQ